AVVPLECSDVRRRPESGLRRDRTQLGVRLRRRLTPGRDEPRYVDDDNGDVRSGGAVAVRGAQGAAKAALYEDRPLRYFCNFRLANHPPPREDARSFTNILTVSGGAKKDSLVRGSANTAMVTAAAGVAPGEPAASIDAASSPHSFFAAFIRLLA